MESPSGAGLPDIVGPGLAVLFCGINPGLFSAAVGHHFARPGNRFFPALHLGGFTDTLLRPVEDRRLLEFGLGLTNLVARPSAGAGELTRAELVEGAARLSATVARLSPRALAVLGMGAYRIAFSKRSAALGEQPQCLGATRIWLLPNPSGAQARYQLPELAACFAEVREALSLPDRREATPSDRTG